MAKKVILVMVLAALVTGGVFALDMSVGFGGNFSANFDKMKYNGVDGQSFRTVGGGLFALFDATYVETDIGFLFGGWKSGYDGYWDEESMIVSYFTLGLLGKYPFDFGIFKLFPMLGIQCDIGLNGKYDGENIYDSSEKADYMNRFWIKFGVGADLNLTRRFYLRPSFLYGINFGSKMYWRELKKAESNLSSSHHGLDIRIAAGFKF